MARGFLQRLWGPISKQNVETPHTVLEVDWSVISGSGLGLIFKALLADLLGAPPPPELEVQKSPYSKQSWRQANVEDAYFQKNLGTSLSRGFLIRGVIYDMQSFIQPPKLVLAIAQAKKESAGKEVIKAGRDWMSLVDEDITKDTGKPKSNVEQGNVEAEEVVEKMGLKSIIPGLTARVQGGPKKGNRKQNLESIIGKADGIRAKYADKIRTKKILADVRREQRELGIVHNPASRSTGSKKGWRVAPGSTVLVRYLEARGLLQGLIARGDEDDVDSFSEQFGNFQFQPTCRALVQANDAVPPKQGLSSQILKDICQIWGLRANQILLVLGEGNGSEEFIKEAGSLGFFLCQMKGARLEDAEEESSDHVIASADIRRAVRSVKAELQRSKGLRTWFRKLASGTLDSDDKGQIAVGSLGVHFLVADMIELKWVVEDLNGVSYRRSTMIRGFEELVGQK